MFKSKIFDDFVIKFNPDMELIGYENHELKDDGVVLRKSNDNECVYEIILKNDSSEELLLAKQYSIGGHFFELQCLLYEIRRNGYITKITPEKDDSYSEVDYRNAISLLIEPMTSENEFLERVALANKEFPHFSKFQYEDLITLDGEVTLSNKNYDGPDLIKNDGDNCLLYYRERGCEIHKMTFTKKQYLYEYLLESQLHII